MAKKLEAELGLNNKSFIDGLSESEGLVGKFGRTIGTLTIALGAAAAGFKILLDWAKATDFGMEAMNVTMGVTKQLLNDIISGQKFNLKEAIANSKEQTKIKQEEAKEGYQVAKMNRELHELEVAAADQTISLTKKKELLTQAMAKEHEIKQFLIDDAKEELQNAAKIYYANINNTKAREDYWNAKKRLEEVQSQDSRRLLSQYTGVLKEEEDQLKKTADAVAALAEEIKNMPGPINPVGLGTTSKKSFSDIAKQVLSADNSQLAGAPVINWDLMGRTMFEGFDQVAQWQGIWENAIMSVTDQMTEAFSKVFQSIGSGDWENVGKEILGSFGGFISNLGKMLVAYGVMKSAFYKSLTAGPAGAAIAIGAGIAAIALGALFQGAASRGTGAMSAGGGGGYTSGGGIQTVKVQIEGVLKGKDIHIAQRRYLEDN